MHVSTSLAVVAASHSALVTPLAASADQLQCATTQNGAIGAMTMWLVSIMEHVGSAGVAFAIMAESLIPPIPSEIILPLAGLTVAQGHMSFISALLWSIFGSLISAWFLYGVAWWMSKRHAHDASDSARSAHSSRITSGKGVARADAWFQKYGPWSVMFGRVLPIVRSLISVPAGLNHMNFGLFTLLTALGSGIWNTLLLSAGYFLGGQWCSIITFLDAFEGVIIGLCVIVAFLLALRWVQSMTHAHANVSTQ